MRMPTGATMAVLTGVLCGSPNVVATPATSSRLAGVDATVSFDQANCDGDCPCGFVTFIQIVRVTGQHVGRLYPHSEIPDRITSDGWYIDRTKGARYGYYGMRDNGSLNRNVTPGTPGSPAMLFDTPRRPRLRRGQRIQWEAITVPVCAVTSDACGPRWLSALAWGWRMEDGGNPLLIPEADVTVIVEVEQQLLRAVNRWNVQATALGREQIPTLSAPTK